MSELRADFSAPLDIDDDEFDNVLDAIVRAFKEGAATLSGGPLKSITIFDPETVEQYSGSLSGSDVMHFANWLDQMLLFAFDDAPDDVIVRWADSEVSKDVRIEGVEYGARALERVSLIRKRLDPVREYWTVLADSPARALGPVTGKLGKTMDGVPFVDVELSEVSDSPRWLIADSSGNRIVIRLLANDLRHLIADMSSFLKEIDSPAE